MTWEVKEKIVEMESNKPFSERIVFQSKNQDECKKFMEEKVKSFKTQGYDGPQRHWWGRNDGELRYEYSLH